MVFRRFTIEMFIRLAFILATLALISYLIVNTSFYATSLLVILAAIMQILSLINYVNRTNAELTRFLNAIRFNDFSQSFSIEHLGSNFADLNEAFDDIMKSFKETRSKKEEQTHYLKVLVEHVPVPLLVIHQTGEVSLFNNAANRMFGTARTLTLDGLDEYGAEFQRDMFQAKAGQTKLTQITVADIKQQVMMSTTQITVFGDRQQLVSLQDIQSHLDATELTAWQNLVRVISHEIMNSITPIASLARTASSLVEEAGKAKGSDPLWDDVSQSIETVARRSEGLMHFVQSYKQLTQMPPPKMQKIVIKPYLLRLQQLMLAEWQELDADEGNSLTLNVEVNPEQLELHGDEQLLDQAMVNLLRNAKDACQGVDNPTILLKARMSERSRIIIEVVDNGAGIGAEKLDKIFMPFFTTKQTGSGVGLALTRKIMLVHQGSISVQTTEGEGTVFKLLF